MRVLQELCRNDGDNNRNEKPARPDEIRKRAKARKPDGEGGQLPRPFLEPGFPLQERRGLHDRQQPCRTVHQAAGEREEELTFLRKRQDGACQRGLPLRSVHLQGYSILEYLKRFFAEIVAGNRDYGKLMPSTIGISANKL